MRSPSKIKCGYFESRFKTTYSEATRESSTVTAFWLVANGIQDGQRYYTEIDFAESGLHWNGPNAMAAYRHHVWPVPAGGVSSRLVSNTSLSNISENYHVYAGEWNASQIRIFHDGKKVGITHDSVDYWGNFKYPMALFISIGVGDITNPLMLSTSEFDYTAEFDYVRVWQRPPSSE